MSDDRDDSGKRPNKDGNGATGDSASPSESPRDKKTRLSTSSVPLTRRQPVGTQDLLVAGINIFILWSGLKYGQAG